MKKIGEISLELFQSGFLEDKPDLLLTDKPTKEYIDKDKGGLPKNLSKNEIFIFVYHPYYDTKIGTTFNVIFPNTNINGWQEVKCTLKYVSVNPSYEIDYIPRGYSALCLFEFEGGIPEAINKLPFFMEKRDPTKHDTLILTQKKVLNKLLNQLETLRLGSVSSRTEM